MVIFRGVDPAKRAHTIDDAVNAVMRRKRSCGVNGHRWSLAELRPDNEDYSWLRNWASQLDADTASIHLQYSERQRKLGLLLLFLAAETCRREAPEDQIWPALVNFDWQPDTAERLFTPNNHPRQLHKDAIEEACRAWKLRHVFDTEGVQQWFQTIPLQFGFTRKGFETRLAEWLVGQKPPCGVQRLLSRVDPNFSERDDPNFSESFELLWDCLKDFRRENISADRFDRIVTDSCWVLPEWREGLKAQAIAKIESLGRGSINVVPEGEPSSQAEEIDRLFVGEPRLDWHPPGEPIFRFELTNLDDWNLQSDHYDVVIGDYTCATILKQPDGSYGPKVGAIPIQTLRTGETAARLVDVDGTTVAVQEVVFWESNDDVTVFKGTTGERIDPWWRVMDPAHSYILITARDLQVVPAGSQLRKHGSHNCVFVAPNWPRDTRVLLDGETLWEPCLTAGGSVARSSRIAVSVDGVVRSGKPSKLDISHPRDAKVCFVRVARQVAEVFPQTSTRTTTGYIVLGDGLRSSTVQVIVGLRDEKGRFQFRDQVRLDIEGIAHLGANGWQLVDPEAELSPSTHENDRFRVFPQRDSGIDDVEFDKWAIMEGDVFIKRPKPVPISLTELSGLGAELTLRRGPYNCPPVDQDQPVVVSVVDTGIVSTAKFDEADQSLTLRLTKGIEPCPEHRLVLLGPGGQVRAVTGSELQVDRNDAKIWRCDIAALPSWFAEPVAVAVAFNGERLGSCWKNDWPRLLLAVHHDEADASVVAALIRWFRLPLLNRHARDAVREFANASPLAAIQGWLFNEEFEVDAPSPLKLRMNDRDVGWIAAVRSMIEGWKPRPEEAHELVDLAEEAMVDCSDGKHVIWDFLITSLKRFPILLSRVANSLVERGASKKCLALVETLQRGLHATENNCDARVARTSEPLRLQVESALGCCPEFIEEMLGTVRSVFREREIEQWQRKNLDIALNLEPFCRLAAYILLDEVKKGIDTRVAT